MTMTAKIDYKKIKEEIDLRLAEASLLEKKRLVERLKEATPVDTGNARDGWKLKDDTIINEVEYIVPLNNGHSQQAPSHFIEKTVLSHPNIKVDGIIVRSS
jgi:hypothetical protein